MFRQFPVTITQFITNVLLSYIITVYYNHRTHNKYNKTIYIYIYIYHNSLYNLHCYMFRQFPVTITQFTTNVLLSYIITVYYNHQTHNKYNKTIYVYIYISQQSVQSTPLHVSTVSSHHHSVYNQCIAKLHNYCLL